MERLSERRVGYDRFVGEHAYRQLTELYRALRLLEQLQKALFRCAVEGNPFVSNASSLPIRVFSVGQCRTGLGPVEGSVPDPPAGLPALYQGQEKRKRVLGWRRTHKDPFKGEWERITSWLMANPEREPRRHFPGATASFPRTLSAPANPHAPARDKENTSPPGSETVEEQWQTEVIRGASPPPVSSAARPTRIS